MTLQLIVNALLTISLPFSIGFVYWHARNLAQRLPEQQRAALEQFARMAAQYVTQEHQQARDKHGLAVSFCFELFKAFKLPVPPRAILDIAIGSAMFEADKQNEQNEQE